jgi:hypothetical protein
LPGSEPPQIRAGLRRFFELEPPPQEKVLVPWAVWQGSGKPPSPSFERERSILTLWVHHMNETDLLVAATILAGALSSTRMHWDESQPDHDKALAAKCVSLAKAIAEARKKPTKSGAKTSNRRTSRTKRLLTRSALIASSGASRKILKKSKKTA